VEYLLKKSIRHYAGQVLDESDGFQVKFLRKVAWSRTSRNTSSTDTFQWPSSDDIDIKQVLSEPTTDHRGRVSFSDTFLFPCLWLQRHILTVI